MCGIYGAFSTDPARPVDAGLLERMALSLAHRGPDGGGMRRAGPVGIGMRRLSIIDTSPAGSTRSTGFAVRACRDRRSALDSRRMLSTRAP